MSSPDNTPLFQLAQVDVAVGDKQILTGLTCHGNDRRIGIVGRNGSGKSTLARLMAGLIPATAGQVRISGINVTKDRKAALRAVGILFQNPDHQIIFPTVGEEIAFGLKQMGQTKAQAQTAVDQVLADFNRPHWAEAPIHQLSQGQKHLVCLMAILVMQPKLVILDEPFAGLDIPTVIQLQRHFAAARPALVHITHDPTTLAEYDRVLWLDEGQIVQDGAAMDVLPAFTSQMQQIGAQDDFSDLSG